MSFELVAALQLDVFRVAEALGKIFEELAPAALCAGSSGGLVHGAASTAPCLAARHLRGLLAERGSRSLWQVGDGSLAPGGGGGLLDVTARGGGLSGTGHEIEGTGAGFRPAAVREADPCRTALTRVTVSRAS